MYQFIVHDFQAVICTATMYVIGILSYSIHLHVYFRTSKSVIFFTIYFRSDQQASRVNTHVGHVVLDLEGRTSLSATYEEK